MLREERTVLKQLNMRWWSFATSLSCLTPDKELMQLSEPWRTFSKLQQTVFRLTDTWDRHFMSHSALLLGKEAKKKKTPSPLPKNHLSRKSQVQFSRGDVPCLFSSMFPLHDLGSGTVSPASEPEIISHL